ncbi:MAG: amino acid racemase [Woeseia sp.]|nr:amino acid racemase [Woeseia sp.]
MGPDATVDFLAKVISLTPAERDQDHIRMLIDHDPKIPSRQNISVADDARVREMLAAMAERLEAGGADFLVMVCNTAHGWLDRARQRVAIPFVSIIDETVRVISVRYPDANNIGILATPACLDTELYQQALERAGLAALPIEDPGRDELMTLIDKVKAGDQSKAVSSAMATIARSLVERGAEAIIAGCTEIPLVLQQAQLTVPLINSTDELARRTVELALGDAPLSGDQRH